MDYNDTFSQDFQDEFDFTEENPLQLDYLPTVNTINQQQQQRHPANIRPGGRTLRPQQPCIGISTSSNKSPRILKHGISPGKGQNFSENEIKVLLFGLYQGKDSNAVATKYLEAFPSTGRTKATLKLKVDKLREECLLKFSGLTTSKGKVQDSSKTELSAAFEFLKPMFIIKKEIDNSRFFWLHKVSNWKEIKVDSCFLFFKFLDLLNRLPTKTKLSDFS